MIWICANGIYKRFARILLYAVVLGPKNVTPTQLWRAQTKRSAILCHICIAGNEKVLDKTYMLKSSYLLGFKIVHKSKVWFVRESLDSGRKR